MDGAAPKRGRNAYPGIAIDDIMAKIGRQGPIEHCLASVMVDGQSLTAITEMQRTPNRYDPRPETKYSEAWAAGIIACSLHLRGIAISTKFPDGKPRETPDLELTAAGFGSVAVEVVRVDETAAARSRLYYAQEQVVEFLKSHPELKPCASLRFTLAYEKAGLLSMAEAEKLADELVDFLKSGRWKLLSRGKCATVFPEGSIAHRFGAVVEVDDPTYSTFLGFERADEMTPFAGILEAIKSKLGLKYVHDHPLWLIVDVVDPRGHFKRALDAVKQAKPDLGPFARVFVHDGSGNVLTLTTS